MIPSPRDPSTVRLVRRWRSIVSQVPNVLSGRLVMHIERFLGDRRALAGLFALADDSPAQVASYIDLGEVLVVREHGAVLGHLQLLETARAGEFEIKNMAILEDHQRRGIGRALVSAAIAAWRAREGRRLIVSTAAADTGNLRFYQRQGFRMAHIVRDRFSPELGYPAGLEVDGIPLRDQVVLEFDDPV